MKDNLEKNRQEEETKPSDAAPQAKPAKVRSKSLQRHIVICPHCGAEALDHMTKCPKCKGELTPTGYRPMNGNGMRTFKRVAWIIGFVVAVFIVVMIFVKGG